MEVDFQIVIGILIISLLFLLIHPIHTFLRFEGFEDRKSRSENGEDDIIEYTFDGKRWSMEQIRMFRETIEMIVKKFGQIQKDLDMTLQEYRAIDGSLLEGAKGKKAEMLKNENDIKDAQDIPGLQTMNRDPVEEYYEPLTEAKKQRETFLAATPEIGERLGVQYEIPKIVLPDMTTLTNIEEYKWLDTPDSKERYEKEQAFYVKIATILPILQKSVGEIYINASLLRRSAGSKTHSLLPRVEALQKEIEEQENMVRDSVTVNEGFEMSKRTCKRTFVYRAEDYSKWEMKLKDATITMFNAEKMVQDAQGDIQIAKNIMENIRKKGEAQRKRIQKLKLSVRKSRLE